MQGKLRRFVTGRLRPPNLFYLFSCLFSSVLAISVLSFTYYQVGYFKSAYYFDLLKNPSVAANISQLNLPYCSVGRLFNGHSPAVFVVNQDAFFKNRDAAELKRKHGIRNNFAFQAYKYSVNPNFIERLEDDIFTASILEEFSEFPPVTFVDLKFKAVYLTHYKKAPERMVEMKKRLSDAGFIWVYLIYQFDKDDLSPQETDCWFTKSAQFVYKYSKGVISLHIKHYFAYYHLAHSNVHTGLVLEDDAWFLNSTQEHLVYEKKLPDEFAFFFSGTCCDKVSPQYDPSKDSIGIYRERENRCTHAYYVSKTGALLMLKLFRTSCPIDHHINQLQIIFPEMEIYWAEPALVLQKNNGSILYGTSPPEENIPYFWDTCYNRSDPLYYSYKSPSFWELS